MCIRIAFLLLIVLVAITTNSVHALSESEYKQNFENCSLNLAAKNCDRDLLTPTDYSKAVATYTSRSRQGLVKSKGRKKPSSTRRSSSSSASPSDAEFISLYSGSNSTYHNQTTKKVIRNFGDGGVPKDYEGDFISDSESHNSPNHVSSTNVPQYPYAASSQTYQSSNQPGTSAAVLPQSSPRNYRNEIKEESTEKELIYSLVIGLVLISCGIGVLYIIILVLKKAGILLTRLKGSNPQIVLPGREEYISNKLSTGRAPVLLSRFFIVCLIGTAISLLFDSYGYFIFLRFCYFATLLYCAQLNYVFGRGLLSGVCVGAAVLFNPFWPVYLYARVPWLIIDSVALICIYLFVDTVKKTYQNYVSE